MPLGGKVERQPVSVVQDIDWCLNKLKDDPDALATYQPILEKGKADIASGKVPDWEFVEALKEMKFLIGEDPADDEAMIRIEKRIQMFENVRREDVREKARLLDRTRTWRPSQKGKAA